MNRIDIPVFKAKLLDELRTELDAPTEMSNPVAGLDKHRTRRRPSALLKIAAGVVVLAAVAAVSLTRTSGNNNPAYAMTEAADGTIRVEIYPDFDDVEALEDSLAAAGLDSVVVHLKGHPSLDGLIEVSSHNNERTGAFEFDNGEFVIEPTAVEGEIEILIYSAAEQGENYQFAPSIFSPGQALGGLPCAYPDTPLDTAELEQRASDVGINNIEWVLFEGDDGEDLDQRPDGNVSGAQLRNAETLLVIVVPELTEPAATTLGMNDGSHYRQAIQCTPDLAARWD